MKYGLSLCLALLSLCSLAQEQKQDTIIRKELQAYRTPKTPHIDGSLDEAEWQQAEAATTFEQNYPVERAPVTQKTEARIMYDNTAIYVGAILYDTSPDSIMKQLGVRDGNITADNFRIVFDTYNTQQDAYDFTVTASGIQMDSRFSDYNYDAVWKSAVKTLPNGWSVEIEIPYSAIRFPAQKEQLWGLQITRNIQRNNEFDQWALTPRGVQNGQKYWGLLKGVTGIDPPVRLSLTPYTTAIWEKNDAAGDASGSTSLSGGLDLKYGINESFTIDATLLPDFSQVQSDNIVKNLGAFEVQLQDKRPFFLEGTDLFSRGDLFYSRRIGQTPSLFYDAPYLLNGNEKLIKNPTRARLLNATKMSGRTPNGLGIGLLNAFVDNTYAVAKDTVSGEERKILTEPRTNFNIFVLDKQMKNGSSAYLINTNVIRTGGSNSANVTGAGVSINNKKNTGNFSASGAVSNQLTPVDSVDGLFNSTLGYKYSTSLQKNSGKWQYGIRREAISSTFNANDLGITFETNYAATRSWLSYNLYHPWKRLLQGSVEFSLSMQQNNKTGSLNSMFYNYFTFMMFKNFNNMFFGIEGAPIDIRDYYEAREPGRIYNRTGYNNIFGGFNTNSNKKVSLNFSFYAGITRDIPGTIPRNPWGGGSAFVNWRLGNRFTLSYGPDFHRDFGDRGWVNTESDGTIVFGRRVIQNITNTISASYVFMRDMSLSIDGRHYWATGHYLNYFVLQEDGNLHDYINYAGSHDYSFNSFNIDMVYKWIFAPGSTISIAWKQNILTEDPVIDYNFVHNFNGTIHAPQYNSISVRVLYYLDYLYIKKALGRKKAG